MPNKQAVHVRSTAVEPAAFEGMVVLWTGPGCLYVSENNFLKTFSRCNTAWLSHDASTIGDEVETGEPTPHGCSTHILDDFWLLLRPSRP
jgi:hypothetical protein